MLINIGIPTSNAAFIEFDTTNNAFWLNEEHTKVNAATVSSIFREIADVIDDESYDGGDMSGGCGMDGIANWQINIDC